MSLTLSLLLAACEPSAMPSDPPQRPVIYQALPRLFGNTATDLHVNGSLERNGCGRFADFDDTALASLRDLGITHLWLTGALEQASGTAYPHRPADDPDLLKGVAGSPYAVSDLFDVCPDYVSPDRVADPQARLEEFRTLCVRAREHGLAVLVDFVPNHVARSHASDVRPDLDLGADDDRSVFFARDNHFFYLQEDHPGGGPPLRLPNADAPGCDGRFAGELEHGRVTGNDAVTWAPSVHDWYETVKLNFGHDFTTGRDTSHLPGPEAALDDVPATWRTLDAVLTHWQELGVAGFRVDMAHMVPLEFWRWALRRARARDASVFFCAEAYDNDPAKLCEGNVLDALLDCGFDAVYDDPMYDLLEGLYEDVKWCNDLDAAADTGERFHRSLRYGENHDEVRLANPTTWGGLGMEVGRPVCAVLYGLGRGPLMLYHGQEVGEPALERAGFGGDGARTTIFDYWRVPELQHWYAEGRCDGSGLDDDRRAMRAWYRDLLAVVREPAFTRGDTRLLNRHNVDNPAYFRMPGEPASGHWVYAFLRRDPTSGQAFLVVANFHPTEAARDVRLRVIESDRAWLGLDEAGAVRLRERLADDWGGSVGGELWSLPELPPLGARVLELG